MKTERDYGFEYAQDSNATELVGIDDMCGGSVDIPTGDYNTMVDDGIDNPDPRTYWAGYNDYVRS